MNWLGLLGLDKRIERYKAAAAELAAGAEDRVELVMIEWQEEKLRLRRVLVLAVVSAMLTIVMLMVASVAFMVQFWDSGHREAAAWLVAGLWFVLWIVAVRALMQASEGGSKAFAATKQEIARDWAEFKGRM